MRDVRPVEWMNLNRTTDMAPLPGGALVRTYEPGGAGNMTALAVAFVPAEAFVNQPKVEAWFETTFAKGLSWRRANGGLQKR